MTSSSKVFFHEPLYERVTMEIGLDKETCDKIEELNSKGFTITDVKMEFYGEGVILHLEKEVVESGDRCKTCYNGLTDNEFEQCEPCKTEEEENE